MGAVVAALARSAQQGILIKGGIVLEALAAAKVITFDKTGTLTKGQTRVRLYLSAQRLVKIVQCTKVHGLAKKLYVLSMFLLAPVT